MTAKMNSPYRHGLPGVVEFRAEPAAVADGTGAMSDSDYQRDAYADPLETHRGPAGEDYVVVVDVHIDGKLRHQIVGYSMGENSAKANADILNQWRDQTRVTN